MGGEVADSNRTYRVGKGMMRAKAVAEPAQAEVLIVGAGPAGATLGFLLRQAGVDALIVDARDVQAKNKLCGGVLVSDAQRCFAEVYGADALAGLEPFAVDVLRMHALDSALSVRVDYRVMPRDRLDSYCLGCYLGIQGRLLDRACLRGIDSATRVANVFDARVGTFKRIRYRTLVGADGATSMARYLATGRKPRVMPSLQGNIASLGSVAISDIRPSDGAVCWYIPQGERAVVGAGGLFDGVGTAPCKERLAEFCARLGIEAPPVRGAALPTGDDILLSAGESCFFVGDAAGLIDPFTGAGIHYALASAQALAAHLTAGVSFEAAMAATVAQISSSAAERDTANLRACLQIAFASQHA